MNETSPSIANFLSELRAFHEFTYQKALPIEVATFFARPEVGWSVAENFSHMARVSRSMSLIFRMPGKLVSPFLGRAKDRPPLEKIKEDYLAGLRKGFSSGPFAPAREESADDARKMAILDEWRYSYQKLEKSLQSYTDEQMRQNQFYHPMLGRITLMETAYIALYHSIHHLQNVERKTGLKLLPE